MNITILQNPTMVVVAVNANKAVTIRKGDPRWNDFIKLQDQLVELVTPKFDEIPCEEWLQKCATKEYKNIVSAENLLRAKYAEENKNECKGCGYDEFACDCKEKRCDCGECTCGGTDCPNCGCGCRNCQGDGDTEICPDCKCIHCQCQFDVEGDEADDHLVKEETFRTVSKGVDDGTRDRLSKKPAIYIKGDEHGADGDRHKAYIVGYITGYLNLGR